MPVIPRPLQRLWRRTAFRWQRNLPMALMFLAILLTVSVLMPLPSLQAFEGLAEEPPALAR